MLLELLSSNWNIGFLYGACDNCEGGESSARVLSLFLGKYAKIKYSEKLCVN